MRVLASRWPGIEPTSNSRYFMLSTASLSALASGVSFFGGILLATVGLFQFFEGISAVRNDKVYASTPQYVYEFDITLWGWVHLTVGAVAVAVGVAIMAGQPWAFFAVTRTRNVLYTSSKTTP